MQNFPSGNIRKSPQGLKMVITKHIQQRDYNNREVQWRMCACAVHHIEYILYIHTSSGYITLLPSI